MGKDWTDDEFGWKEVRAELARIRRRVRARWLLTILLALVLTGLVIVRQARRERTYRATVMLRVMEGQFDPDSAPPTSAQLQEYLWEVALSRARLFEVMEEHNLYGSERRIDPLLALDEMRDVLDVKVLRNYFQIERDPDAPPRSARIALSYAHGDPEKALEVTRALANIMAEQEAKTRRESTEVALASMRDSATTLDSALVAARMEESRLVYELSTGDPAQAPARTVRLVSLRRQIQSLEDQKSLANMAVSNLGLRNQVEGRELGLRFEIIDPGRVPKVVIADSTRLALLGCIAFLFLLPVAGTGIAAYDLRIYDADDLKRLGLRPFGHVPPFRGYRQGTLCDRLRRRTGASC
jgi:hypothetical protein